MVEPVVMGPMDLPARPAATELFQETGRRASTD
jgi:hypothetical protein